MREIHSVEKEKKICTQQVHRKTYRLKTGNNEKKKIIIRKLGQNLGQAT